MKQQLSTKCTYEPYFFHYNRDLSVNMSNPHMHENYEIYYLISGQRRYFIEDEIYDIYPGDMILIPPKCPHRVWSTPNISRNEYHERYLISPTKEDIPEVFLPCFDTHFYHLTGRAKEIIADCFQSLHENYNCHDNYTNYHNHANLLKILCTLARLPISEKHTNQLSKKDMIMQDAALYIKNNCSQNLKLSEIAEKYHFSKEYFSTSFKESTGFGFKEYLNQMRISKSVDLLSSTSMSITEISATCGYNDSNYFASVFKKIMGGSPRKFRPKLN